MDADGKDRAGLLGFALATVVSAILWVGLVVAFRALSGLPLETLLKATALGFLVLGSWLIFRALAAVDR
jgi:hypothetical protein